MRYPLERVWLSRGFTSSHPAADIGWFRDYGPNEPVCSPADGTVVSAVDGFSNTPDNRLYGNYVTIYHGLEGERAVYTLHAHLLKNSVSVKAGQSVRMGEAIGKMNNSGYSFGSHTHCEVRVGGNGSRYREDPAKWFFIYPDQYVDSDSEKKYGIKRYTPLSVVGVPDGEKKDKGQIKVVSSCLRSRTGPQISADNIEGFIAQGYYDVTSRTTADGFDWCLVNNSHWIAEVKGASEYIEKSGVNVTVFGCTAQQAKFFEDAAADRGLKTERRNA